MQDRFALEVERTIYNWHYGGQEAIQPVMNALQAGLRGDMQVYVPIRTPDISQCIAKDPESLRVGDTVTLDAPLAISFQHLPAEEQGKYYLPVFTSSAEAQKGEPGSLISQPLQALFDASVGWKDCLGFVFNPWDKPLPFTRDAMELLRKHVPKSRIELVRGSVVDMHAGAIVNAANTTLLGGGGVDGAIHRAAGPELLKECRTLHGCKTGQAKITGAYRIDYADYIIHTPGPVYGGRKQDEQLLTGCYQNSLDLALAHGCSSIAFPCISTGVYGYPLNEAALVSLAAASSWLDAHQNVVMNIYFCCFRDAELATYRRIFQQLSGQPG